LFLDAIKIENIFIKKRVEKNLIEYGAPQWVTGIKFFSGTIKNLFCVAKKENILIVEQYKDLEFVKEFSTPFTSISDFSVFQNKVLLKGYGSEFLGIVFEIDFAKKVLSDNPELISKLLAKRGCNKVLWECGPGLATAAIQSNCIQELITFIAPKILGGENSMNPLGDFEFGEMHEIIKLSESQLSLIEDDICVKSIFKN